MEIQVVESVDAFLNATDIKSVSTSALENVNDCFEVITDNNDNRVYIDLDGKMPDEMAEDEFDELNEKVREKLMMIDDTALMTRSSYRANVFEKVKFKVWKKTGETIHKISYRITFTKEAVKGGENSLKFMKEEIVLREKLPMLKGLLDGIIEISDKEKSGALNIDTSVYRGGQGGKMSCVNNKKFKDDDRINTLIKGSVMDTIIRVPDESAVKFITERKPEPEPEPEVESEAEPEPEPQPEPKPKKPTPQQAQKKKKPVEDDEDDYYEMKEETLDAILDKIGETNKGRDFYRDYNSWMTLVYIFVNEGWNFKILDKYSKKYGGDKYNKEKNAYCYEKARARPKGFKEPKLWKILEQTNMDYYDEIASDRKDIWIFLKNANHEKYSQLYFQLQPDKYIYSPLSGWYSYNPNNTLRACGKTAPLGLINDVSDVLGRHINKHGRKCLPEDPRDQEYQPKQKLLNDAIKQLGTSWFSKGIIDYITIHYVNDEIDGLIDQNTDIIAFNDCVFDIKIGVTRPIQRRDFIVKTCGYDFLVREEKVGEDKENEEKVKKFIDSIFEEKLRDFWWKVMSLSVFGNKFMKLLCHTGSGGNGKGMISTLLKNALGQYYFAPENTFLTTSFRASAPNPTLLLCKGMRIVMTSEPDNNQQECQLNADFVKSMTGGDPITTRGLHKDPITFMPTFTTHIQANNMPKVKLDGGVTRRLCMIPHIYEFKDASKIDKENPLHKPKNDNLAREISDTKFIRAFMRILLKTAYENKDKFYDQLGEPKEIQETADKYCDENNPIKGFLEEFYYTDKKETTLNKFIDQRDFLREYNAFCNRDQQLTTSKMNKLLRFNGFELKVSSGVSYIKYLKKKDDTETNPLDV